MQTVVEAITPEIEAAGRQLTLDIAPSLHEVTGDAGRLELALLNLLRNALQASETAVDVKLTTDGAWLDIRITDDGPGLPDQPVEKLLEPFFTTKSPGEGTGLGLAIVQSVADEHGGELTLESGQGHCVVTLRLPLDRHAAQDIIHDA